MKFADVTGMTVEELRKKATEIRSELFEAKMKNQMGQLNNPIRIRQLRRDVARLHTAMTEKLSR